MSKSLLSRYRECIQTAQHPDDLDWTDPYDIQKTKRIKFKGGMYDDDDTQIIDSNLADIEFVDSLRDGRRDPSALE